MLFLEPKLNFLGPLPASSLETSRQFVEGLGLYLRRVAAAMLAFQQTGHAAGLQRLHPVEKTAAADPQLPGDLPGGQFAADRQSRRQQTP